MNNSIPKIGDGCTVSIGSDSVGATVTFVSISETIIEVQEDTATRTDNNGMSDTQEYSYEPNPNGRKRYYRNDGAKGWREVRQNGPRWKLTNGGCYRLSLGGRHSHYDYSF